MCVKVCVCVCVCGGHCAHPCRFAGCTRAPQVWSTEGAVLGSCPPAHPCWWLQQIFLQLLSSSAQYGVPFLRAPAQGRGQLCYCGKSTALQNTPTEKQHGFSWYLPAALEIYFHLLKEDCAWMPMWTSCVRIRLARRIP